MFCFPQYSPRRTTSQHLSHLPQRFQGWSAPMSSSASTSPALRRTTALRKTTTRPASAASLPAGSGCLSTGWRTDVRSWEGHTLFSDFSGKEGKMFPEDPGRSKIVEALWKPFLVCLKVEEATKGNLHGEDDDFGTPKNLMQESQGVWIRNLEGEPFNNGALPRRFGRNGVE